MFGAGRALLCLESAGLIPDSGESRADLTQVVDTYDAQGENHDGDLRELAAEAEALIGFANARAAQDAVSRRQALEHIDRALELTTFTERQVAFRIAKADAHIVWGDRSTACVEIDLAASLLGPDGGDELRAHYTC